METDASMVRSEVPVRGLVGLVIVTNAIDYNSCPCAKIADFNRSDFPLRGSKRKEVPQKKSDFRSEFAE